MIRRRMTTLQRAEAAVSPTESAAVNAEVRELIRETTERVRALGRGFDPQSPAQDGIGLIGARERLRLLGGRLTVVSAVGSRTTLTAAVPVQRRLVTAPAARP